MRYLIVFLMVSTSAIADDLDALKERYYENRQACREGYAGDKQLTAEETDKACKQLERLAGVLKKGGQCWDNGEVEWRECKR